MGFWINSPYNPEGYCLCKGGELEKNNILGVCSVGHAWSALL